MEKIKVTRKTTESVMSVKLDFAPLSADYREKINTTVTFLNHMIEHIAWRGGFNIEVSVELDKFILTHVIAEDLGMALGMAVREYILRTDGTLGYGDAVGIIDEAKADCAVSFEERAYCNIDYHGIEPAETVEGMYSEDLETFLEGFAQGAKCTLHIDLQKGHNGHHIWEAIFRALGMTLNRAMAVSQERKGKTAGVAGRIEWTVE